MHKVLIITRHYLDEKNGGSNASKGFIFAFAKLYTKCSLIYPEHRNFDSKDFIPDSVERIPVYDERSKIQKGIDVYRGWLHRFPNFVRMHLINNHYDIIVLDHSVTAAGVIKVVKSSGAKIITIHHNVETKYLKDNEPSWLYRMPYNFFAIRAERLSVRLSDVNLTLTEEDAKELNSLYASPKGRFYTIGINEYNAIEKKNIKDNSFNNVFVISGSLCFRQSSVPVLEFIEKYYPILENFCPHCKLIITGRNPSEEMKAICNKHNGIMLVPNPENMESVIEQASVYICPIDAGSGIKLRVMDGLKSGRLVICHSVSSVGYETLLKAGYIYSYNDSESFKSALLKIRKKNYTAKDVYKAFLKDFSFDSGVARLKRILLTEGLI